MQRTSWLCTLYLALMCGLTVMASATRVIVSVDLQTRNTPVTLTVQDAEITGRVECLI